MLACPTAPKLALANQSAGQASQDKAAPPADTESPPQTGGQTESQHPVPGGPYDFHRDQWAALYAKRLDAMIAALKSKGGAGYLGRVAGNSWHQGDQRYELLDELYRERAERAAIIYVDIWDGFVDAVQGPDFEGQTRRLRGQQLAYIYFEE